MKSFGWICVIAVLFATSLAVAQKSKPKQTKLQRPAILNDSSITATDYLPGEHPSFRKLMVPIYTEVKAALELAKTEVESKPQSIRQSLYAKAKTRSLTAICRKYKISAPQLNFVILAAETYKWPDGGPKEGDQEPAPAPDDYGKAIMWEQAYLQYDQFVLQQETETKKAAASATVGPRAGSSVPLGSFNAVVQSKINASSKPVPVEPCGIPLQGGRVCKRAVAGGGRCYLHRTENDPQ